jgi:carbon-monoxide dehydrogenase medium subunit
MKAAPFAYVRPGTVQDAVTELGQEGAKVLAGGQSLVPVLAMRLGRPSTLVDINAIPELRKVVREDGTVRVSACVRQRQLHHHEVSADVPLLRLALPWVGHREVRSRGTVCGSIAHADPSAELPAVATCLDATMVIRSARGQREVPASQFFTGAMATAVKPDELLTEVRFPVAAPREGFGFAEFARRHGDFALAGVAVRAGTEQGRLRAKVTCFGVSDRPVSADVSTGLQAAVDTLGGTPAESTLRTALQDVAADVADRLVDTGGDSHASTSYRKQLITALAAREISRAYLKTRPNTAENTTR